MDFAAKKRVGKTEMGLGPAECAMAAYFASRKQIRILHGFLLGAPTRLSPKGAGRIQSLRAFRRAGKRKEGRGKREEGRGEEGKGGSWVLLDLFGITLGVARGPLRILMRILDDFGCPSRRVMHQGCTKEAIALRDGPQGTPHTSRALRT